MRNGILSIAEHGVTCNPMKYKYKHSPKHK